MSNINTTAAWLLLIHQLPPKPDYLRVKIWRRLQGLGAVAVKNSVYALPNSDQAREDFQWLQKEIVAASGDAVICEAHFIDGADEGVRLLFQDARDTDYQSLTNDIRQALADSAAKKPHYEELRARLGRLRKRFDQIMGIDFFQTGRRAETAALVNALEGALSKHEQRNTGQPVLTKDRIVGRTWATRRNIRVDRMASAWLIRRFIDPAARFAFINEKDRSTKGHLRFDMAAADYTHEADRCTFEVLLDRFELTDKALVSIGQVIHDLDLKDGKFQSESAAGIGSILAGIAAADVTDEERVRQASSVFDALHRAWS